MPQVVALPPVINIEGIDVDEIAFLSFTNSPVVDAQSDQPTVLTTKEAYIWAQAVSMIVQGAPEITCDEILSAYKAAVHDNKKYLRQYYRYIFRDPQVFIQSIEQLFHDFTSNCGQGHLTFEIVSQETEKTFQKLTALGYIEDPIYIDITSLGLVAILGFVPYGYTSLTRKGRVVHRQLNSLFVDITSDQTKDGKKFQIKLKIHKILKAFRSGMTDEVEKMDDDKDEHK